MCSSAIEVDSLQEAKAWRMSMPWESLCGDRCLSCSTNMKGRTTEWIACLQSFSYYFAREGWWTFQKDISFLSNHIGLGWWSSQSTSESLDTICLYLLGELQGPNQCRQPKIRLFSEDLYPLILIDWMLSLNALFNDSLKTWCLSRRAGLPRQNLLIKLDTRLAYY